MHKLKKYAASTIYAFGSAWKTVTGGVEVSVPSSLEVRKQTRYRQASEFQVMEHGDYCRMVAAIPQKERYTYPSWDQVEASIASGVKLKSSSWSRPKYT